MIDLKQGTAKINLNNAFKDIETENYACMTCVTIFNPDQR